MELLLIKVLSLKASQLLHELVGLELTLVVLLGLWNLQEVLLKLFEVVVVELSPVELLLGGL